MNADIAALPLGPGEAEAAARLHAGMDEAWSVTDWTTFLADPLVIGFGAESGGALIGVVLVRVLFDEAEVLTLYVGSRERRRRVGGGLLAAALSAAAARGASAVYLEVAADNTAAIGLYTRHGFVEIGRRRGYYRRPTGTSDALTMRCSLPLDAGARPT